MSTRPVQPQPQPQPQPSLPPRVPAAEQKLLWTCVARATIPFSVHTGSNQDVPHNASSASSFKDGAPHVLILAEAGEDPWFNGLVAQTARELLQKRATAGWEYHNSSNSSSMSSSINNFWNKNKSQSSQEGQSQQQQQQQPQQPQQQPAPPRLKGIKFHLYDNSAACLRDNNDNNNNKDDNTGCHNEMLLWVFCAVYNPAAIEQNAVKSFIEKMIVLTELYRDTDETWRQGTTLSCQASFAPILQQRMQEVSYMEQQHGGDKKQLAVLQHQLDITKSVMHDNIQLILQREEQLQELQERTTHLQDLARDFKKRSKIVRQKIMWQNARHGVMLGGAISAGVAIVVVPPLVALL